MKKEISEPVYKVMDMKNNMVYGAKHETIEEARGYINNIISGLYADGVSSPSLCIMIEHMEKIKDDRSILVESNKVLKRAEDCYYTNFNGVTYTDTVYSKKIYW